ncbi:MAG: DUF1048 domain-containing protein [Propionibacteriaceae bacterium]|jgi:DNA-binding ferritin-like protein (Dps family)|nr:DUF1048 domain-containing protein [Propionibacteriaceae bacterium]
MSESQNPTMLGKLRDKLIGTREGKREWREHRRRVKALPPDYEIVMEKIQKFLWTCSGAVDDQCWLVLYDICDLFEESAAAGRGVLEVTGDDVARFSLDMLAATQARTWMGQKADQLNADIHRLLGRKADHDG